MSPGTCILSIAKRGWISRETGPMVVLDLLEGRKWLLSDGEVREKIVR
jgi:hypothetical protein